MAISRVVLYNYVSTDTKPTLDISAHSILIEKDTGNMFIFDGIAWRQSGIAGVPMTNLNGGTLDYGTYPQNAYLDINGIIAASSTTAADLFVSNDISIYDSVAFEIYAISGTTPAIKIVPSYDGTTYSVTPLAITDLSSGALTTAIAGGTGATVIGNYMVAIPAKARKIKMLFTAGVAGGASMRGGIWKR